MTNDTPRAPQAKPREPFTFFYRAAMAVSHVVFTVLTPVTYHGLEYVDISYHHRPDPDTPLYETMSALDLIARQGKALYVGLSNYPAPLAAQAMDMLRELGTPCLIHQPR